MKSVSFLFQKIFALEQENLQPFSRKLAERISQRSLWRICRAINRLNRWAKRSSSQQEEREYYQWKNFFLNALILKQGTGGKIIWGEKEEKARNSQLLLALDPDAQKLLLSCHLGRKEDELLQVHLPLREVWPESVRIISREIGQDLKFLVLTKKWGARIKTK